MTSLKEECRPQVVRSGFRRRDGKRAQPPTGTPSPGVPSRRSSSGDHDGTTHVPCPSGRRRRPPATAYGAQGCPASPRATLGLAELPRGRRLLPAATGPRDAATGRGAVEAAAAATAARAGWVLPGRRTRKLGPRRGRPAARNRHSPCLRP